MKISQINRLYKNVQDKLKIRQNPKKNKKQLIFTIIKQKYPPKNLPINFFVQIFTINFAPSTVNTYTLQYYILKDIFSITIV